MEIVPSPLGRQNEQWYYHSDYSTEVRAVKAEFSVYLRILGQQVNWVVTDKDPNGQNYIVMLVQEPDGRYRPFDGRTLENLRKAFQRDTDDLLREIEDKERKKAKADEARDLDIAHGIASDLKYAGHVITPTVAARERSVSRGN